MIEGKSILAIIPARGGSKGIPKKNVRLLAGKPLIAWTIEEAKKSKYLDRVIVSSDDDEIISVSKMFKCEVPFRRPVELAGDSSTSVEVIDHALKTLDREYDFFILLQLTSPLRTTEHIDEAIELCVSSKAKGCVSVSEVTKPIQWTYTLNFSRFIKPIINKDVQRRQDADKQYYLNGSIYISETEHFHKTHSLINANTIGYLMDKESSIDIDDMADFNIAEYLMLKRLKEK